jgi:hypothetical protein
MVDVKTLITFPHEKAPRLNEHGISFCILASIPDFPCMAHFQLLNNESMYHVTMHVELNKMRNDIIHRLNVHLKYNYKIEGSRLIPESEGKAFFSSCYHVC